MVFILLLLKRHNYLKINLISWFEIITIALKISLTWLLATGEKIQETKLQRCRFTLKRQSTVECSSPAGVTASDIVVYGKWSITEGRDGTGQGQCTDRIMSHPPWVGRCGEVVKLYCSLFILNYITAQYLLLQFISNTQIFTAELF